MDTAIGASYIVLRDAYLRDLATEGAAARTVAAYRRDLDDTADTLIEAGRDGPTPGIDAETSRSGFDLEDVTAADVRAAVATYRERPDPRFTARPESAPAERARATVARRVAVLRAFFGWAHAEGHLPTNPAARLRARRLPEQEPKHLHEPQVRAVLAAPGRTSRWPERDLLIALLAAGAGLRAGEIIRLPLDAADAQHPERGLLLRGKGGRQRRIPVLPPPLAAAWAKYLPTRAVRLRAAARRHGALPAARTLILARTAHVDRAGRLTMEPSPNVVTYVIDRDLAATLPNGREPGMGPHTLRHTFATLALRSGAANVRQVQELLGHAHLSTTERYLHVSDDELAEALARHPLASPDTRGTAQDALFAV